LIFAVMLVQFAAKPSEMKIFGKYFRNFTGFAALRCPCHAQPGQSEDFQLCAMLKPSNETGCLM